MAKLAFSKITPIKSLEDKIITIGEEQVSVRQYLPVDDKAKMVERILAASFDENGFASPVRVNIYFGLELIRCYTNINITEKMFENAGKTYDSLVMNNVIDIVKRALPVAEYDELQHFVYGCVTHIEQYNSSFVGMMKTVTQDYDATKINIEEIMATLDQPDKIGMVKDVLDKMG